MRTAGGLLLVGWLVAALVVLDMDGRLPAFLAGAVPGTLVLLGVAALVRHQLAPARYNLPPTPPSAIPARYRVADDLRQPLADVVAAAEQDATTAVTHRRSY